MKISYLFSYLGDSLRIKKTKLIKSKSYKSYKIKLYNSVLNIFFSSYSSFPLVINLINSILFQFGIKR